MHKNLRAEMARNRLTIGDLAKALNVRRATVSDKINGKRRFYYEECLKIKETFFPDLSIEYLFEKDEEKRNGDLKEVTQSENRETSIRGNPY